MALPPFSINRTDDYNNTVWLSFPEMCSELGAAIGLIPLIAILEQVAIAKSFGIRICALNHTIIKSMSIKTIKIIFFPFTLRPACGKRTDATQEMIALGIGNLLGSFVGAMPITSSFGRSSVQSASGVKTPFANIYGGSDIQP